MATVTPKPAGLLLSDRQWKAMKAEIVAVGWIGLILSSVTLLLATLAMHFRCELVEAFLEAAPFYSDRINANAHRAAIVGSTFLYGLSLLNLVACTMLLVGLERRSSALLFPWLIFHAVCFAGTVHIGTYITIALFFECIPLFVISLLAFSGGLTIFAKILKKVHTCFTQMEEFEEQKRSARDAEKRNQQNVPNNADMANNITLPYYTL